MIYVIGIGVNGRKSISRDALNIIMRSGLVAGSARHLKEFPLLKAEKFAFSGGLDKALGIIKERLGQGKDIAVLATGDPLLFGIGELIIRKFGKDNVCVIPNVSVVQEAFARIKKGSAGVKVLSAHGRGAGALEGVVSGVMGADKAAIFTDHANSPAKIAKALLNAGLKDYTVYVCSGIGSKKERVVEGGLKYISLRKFSEPNTMILVKESVKEGPRREAGFGLPDGLFAHSKGMITKSEIRAISLSRLGLNENSVVWDIGSGSGSVAVEAALIAGKGAVFAAEKQGVRLRHIRENKRRFGVENLFLINGSAPECMKKKGLPRPDAVFVGGGGADIKGILRHACGRLKAGGAIVVNAVTIETAGIAIDFLKKKGFIGTDAVQVGVSRIKAVGGLNMLSACNPVFIISGRK
ncbi:MAG: precorrin-6y C5,15-methyltransferase (decarboxylating) subunit CbiE [Deltaproteobacteria bacterium]